MIQSTRHAIASLTCVTILVALLGNFAQGQQTAPSTEWFADHNGSREESHGHSIMECADGGFLQIGETGYVGSNARILVVKTDASGSLAWKKEFGSGNRNMGNSALEVEDGYLICGMLNRNSAILKLNKTNGTTIFQKTLDNGGADAFEHLAATSNGILAVGYRQAEDPNNTFFVYGQGYISFLDETGNLISGQSVNAYLSQAYRVKPTGDDFIISGGTEDALRYGVIKINANGNVLWNRNFGGSNEDHCFGMDLGADGTIFLGGHSLSGTANWDTYTMKLDADGNQLWERKQGNPRGFNPTWIHDETWGIKATPDGGCVISAGTGDEYSYSECNAGVCSDQWEAYIVKFDAIGGLDWQATYSGGPGQDWAAEDIDLTSDGGAIVAVDNSQFGFLKLETFLQSEGLEGDLNGDGCVTGQDLAIILANWGRAEGNPADLDGDGVDESEIKNRFCNQAIKIELTPLKGDLLPKPSMITSPRSQLWQWDNEKIHSGGMSTLSPREREVVMGLADGLSRAQIADRMEVSVNTVSTLTQRAYKKIGVTSQAQLAAQISGHAREKLSKS